MLNRTKPESSLAIKAACFGALAFWGPDTVIHAIRRHSFASSDVLIVTVAMPLILLATLLGCARAFRITTSTTAVCMLAGVWLLGGAFMLIGATFSGGGFLGPDGIRGTLGLMGISWMPMITFMLATYDGSLGALLLASLLLVSMWMVGLKSLRSKFAAGRSQQ